MEKSFFICLLFTHIVLIFAALWLVEERILEKQAYTTSHLIAIQVHSLLIGYRFKAFLSNPCKKYKNRLLKIFK